MNLVIILAAVALLFVALILFIKISSWIAQHAESLTKVLFGVAILLLIAAGVAAWKPELCPQLTQACDTVAKSIKGFAQPFLC